MSREAHVRICERLGYVRPRSTRLMISIPPKYAVSQVIGFIKGKSAIHIARMYAGHAHAMNGSESCGLVAYPWCSDRRLKK